MGASTRLRSSRRVAQFAVAIVLLLCLGTFAGGALADDPPSGPPPAPTVNTDKATYAPSDTVSISGGNWIVGETVHLHVADDGGNGWSRDVDVLAGADGTISDSFVLPSEFAAGFGVSATGALGETAATSFSDAFAAPAAAPTIISDKADYTPGETVTLSGSNWRPGESVQIVVNDTEGQTWSRNVDVTATADGSIRDQFSLPNYFVASYTATATGALSGSVTTTFTDGNVSFALATADTVTPSSWTVNWTKYDDGICTSTQSTGSTSGPGNAGIGANKSLKPTSVTPASGYTFMYWSDTASGTTPSANICTPDSATPRTLYAHFQLSVQATSLGVASATGTYGGTVNLSATLTSGGSGVGSKSISFTLNGTSVGSASTNGSGVATMNGASLSGINVGSYPSGVQASFAGDSSYSGSSGSNSLTVNQAAQDTLSVSSPDDGTYGDTLTPAASGGSGTGALSFSASGSACEMGTTRASS